MSHPEILWCLTGLLDNSCGKTVNFSSHFVDFVTLMRRDSDF